MKYIQILILLNLKLININFLTKNIKIKNEKLTDKQKLFFKKTDIFHIFNQLDTYFTLSLYESINKYKLKDVFNELKLIWNKFLFDYNYRRI